MPSAAFGQNGFEVYTRDAGSTDTLRLGVGTGTDTATAYFQNANVGIGTASVAALLDLQLTASPPANAIRLRNSSLATLFAVDPSGNVTAASFTGSGSGLSSGTVPDGALSSNVALLNRDGQVFTGQDIFRRGTNSTTAFQVQDSASATWLNVDTSNGRVGIGTTAPAALLDLAGGTSYAANRLESLSATFTGIDGSVTKYGVYDAFTLSGNTDAANGGPHYGVYVSLTSNLTVTTYQPNLYGVYATVDTPSGYAVGNVYGGSFNAAVNNGSNNGVAYGIVGTATNAHTSGSRATVAGAVTTGQVTAAGGTTTDVIGTYALAKATAAATVTNLSGVKASPQLFTSGATVTDASAFRADLNMTVGTVSNVYGLYVPALAKSGGSVTTAYAAKLDAPTAGTTNYALYSTSGTNYFGGNVGISSSNPQSRLDLGVGVAAGTDTLFMPRKTATGHPSSPSAGMVYYNIGDAKFYGYNGSSWLDLGSGTGGTFTLAGTSGTPQTITVGSDTLTVGAGTNMTTTAGATDTVTVATVANPTFSTSVTSPLHTGTGAVTLSSGGSSALTLDSASDVLVVSDPELRISGSGGHRVYAANLGAVWTNLALDSANGEIFFVDPIRVDTSGAANMEISESAINRTSANLTLQTTTSGNVLLSPAGNVGVNSANPTAGRLQVLETGTTQDALYVKYTGTTGAFGAIYAEGNSSNGSSYGLFAKGTNNASWAARMQLTGSGTTGVTGIATLERASTGTAANGLGGRLDFQVQDDAGTQRGAASIGALLSSVAAASPQGMMTFYTRAGASGLLERMRIDNTGAVGIGTTAPLEPLTVGTTTANAWHIGQTDAASGAWLRNDGSNPVISTNVGDMYFGYSGNSKNLRFMGGGTTTQMILLSGGNVGIGSTNPAQKLDVAGTVQMTGFKLTTGANNNYVLTSDVSGVGTWQASGASLWSRSGSNTYLTNSGDNVGIGTSSPAATLQINDASTTYNGEAGSLAVWLTTNTAKRLYLGWDNAVDTNGAGYLQSVQSGVAYRSLLLNPAGGNVGVGTTVPASKLDVKGTLTTNALTCSGTMTVGGTSGTFNMGTTGTATMNLCNAWSLVLTDAPSGTDGFQVNDTSNFTFNIKNFGTGTAHLTVEGTVTGASKNFRIDHPVKPGMYLQHSCIEGPEVAVFYRGEARLDAGQCTVTLPDYFEALTRKEGRTVLLTPVGGWSPLYVESGVTDGKFVVRTTAAGSAGQKFYWEVKAVRADQAPLEVEKPMTPDESRLSEVKKKSRLEESARAAAPAGAAFPTGGGR